MADRKQFLNSKPADPQLLQLLESTRDVVVPDDVLREQRVSFAFGNAMNIAGITKDSVRHSSESLRLRTSEAISR